MDDKIDDKNMRRLHLRRRDFLSGFFEKASLMILAALVIGQLITFVQDKAINWWVFVASLLMIYVLMKLAVNLKDPTK